VPEPHTNQIVWRFLSPQPCCSKTPEDMKASFFDAHHVKNRIKDSISILADSYAESFLTCCTDTAFRSARCSETFFEY